jgi:hypothetical protein
LDHFKTEPLITATEGRERYLVKRTDLITRFITRNVMIRGHSYPVRLKPRPYKYSREDAIRTCFEKYKIVQALRAALKKQQEKNYNKNEEKALKLLNLYKIELF